MRILTLRGLGKAAVNLLFVLLFALLTLSSYRQLIASGSLRSLGILAVNMLFLTLFLSRRPATQETDAPGLWALGVLGSLLPLLMRPTGGSGSTPGAALQLAGLAMLVTSLMSLRTRFAVVPANRGVCGTGLYRLVRHPIYLSELTVFLGVTLDNPTPGNLTILVIECALQWVRARAEEQLLGTDPQYAAYRRRVRYRLIPGLL